MLFTFPSRYWFTIGLSDIFSLAGWSRRIHTGFHVSRATQDTPNAESTYEYATVMLYGWTFQIILLHCFVVQRCPTTPILPKQYWFGLFPVRSPLLRESLLFSFPAGTKMFQFPAYASVNTDTWSSIKWVVPFGDPGIKGYLHLTPGLSQLITSFIASESLGIHRSPFFAFLFALNYTSSFALLYSYLITSVKLFTCFFDS